MTLDLDVIKTKYISSLCDYCSSRTRSDKYGSLRFSLDYNTTIESFLISVANISKILWPSAPCGSELSNRRKDLRLYLSIDDNSPLRSRIFRNHFEHYDSRIEEWVIIDSNIGPIEQVITGLNKSNLFYIRNFDPYKFVLTVRGQEYEFNHVLTAIKNIQKRINR